MMRIKKTKKIIFSFYEKIIMVSIILSFLVITSVNLKTGFGKVLNESSSSSGVTFFSSIIIIVFFSSLFKKKESKRMSVKIVLFFFSLYFFIFYLSSMEIINILDLVDILILLLWVMCFILGAYFSHFGKEKLYKFIFYFSVFMILPITVQTFYYQTNIFSSLIGGNDWVFSTIVFFPFVLLLDRNKLFRLILISLFFVISLISLKRTIIISSTTLLFLYFILSSDIKGKIKQFFSRYFLIIIPLIFIIYNYLSQLINKKIFSRFESLGEDGGSGRDIIYEEAINIFQNSSVNEMYFGHGYKSTIKYIGVLSHNDSLQIMIDFGLIGLGLYLIFIIFLLMMIIKRYRNRKFYRTEYAVYVASIASFLILSQTNCIIYSPFIITPIMFIIGILYFRLSNTNYISR